MFLLTSLEQLLRIIYLAQKGSTNVKHFADRRTLLIRYQKPTCIDNFDIISLAVRSKLEPPPGLPSSRSKYAALEIAEEFY